jgi:hypothetical protein
MKAAIAKRALRRRRIGKAAVARNLH